MARKNILRKHEKRQDEDITSTKRLKHKRENMKNLLKKSKSTESESKVKKSWMEKRKERKEQRRQAKLDYQNKKKAEKERWKTLSAKEKKAEREQIRKELFGQTVNEQGNAIYKPFNWWKLIINIVLFPFRVVEFIFKIFWGSLNILFLIAAIGCFAGIFVFAKVYPMYQEASTTAYEKLAKIQDSDFRMFQNTMIYDKNGKILGEIDAGDYHYIDIKEVSDWVQKGYMAAEDKRFMQHIGIDLQSIARAALSIVRHSGEVTQGGSTITQQVIKNNVLSQEQTYSRKLVEILIAPKLEQMYSKTKIMEFYVNTNYYFGKSCKDLNIAEAAMLCGVSNGPNSYNPVASMKLARQRMKYVLKRMLDDEYITKKQYKKALKTKIKIKAALDEYDNDNYMISYALYCTALELMKEDGFEFQYLFDSAADEEAYQEKYQSAYTEKASLIRAGGYSIYTSFDTKLQKKLQSSVDNQLASYTEKTEDGRFALQGAAVCIDNRTGYVVAMVGGRGDNDEFNRAFLARRQPGSSIKPLLVYAPAVNDGVVNPSTIYTDKPVYAIDGDTSSYSPRNSGGGYRGDMKVREALARSINTIAYQIYRDTGKAEALSYLDAMKFSTLTYADTTAESLCLGGFTEGVRIVDLAKGYATLPMNGQYSDRTCITKIDHETLDVLYEEKSLADSEKEVFTPDTAYMVTDMMEGTFNESYGTAAKKRNPSMIVAGKTGTTSSSKDVWFSGFSKYYTCSVWVGYDTPRAMSGQYGSGMPLGIWNEFMTGIKKNMTEADFDKPKTVSLRGVRSGSYYGKDIALKLGEPTTIKNEVTTTDDKDEQDGVATSTNSVQETTITATRYYYLRGSGTEWYSKLNEEAFSQKQHEIEVKQSYDIANNNVKLFEMYYISSIDDALGLDDYYKEIESYIDLCLDDYLKGKLRKRAAKHYNQLQDNVMEDWQKYIDEYNASEKAVATARQQEELDNSKLAAKEALKQNRINKAEWYLAELYNRNYNTSVTQLLLSDAKTAIARLKGYSEYSSYKERLDSAESRISGLPTDVASPEIEYDSSDNSSYVDSNQYYDKEVEDYKRALEEYNRKKQELENNKTQLEQDEAQLSEDEKSLEKQQKDLETRRQKLEEAQEQYEQDLEELEADESFETTMDDEY